ncbi:N-acetylmuramoyl-L-alanine amidase [Lapidilactobacillus bayanensis]|uniref:N-acetylmuramoyl-L-alanine amidase n=1 Tax=Lapidilactobacillus bayanensis TaxID=2485998 RepID=UPI000F76B225|nr:N-acetylmuramoyl-L-alanine amidase [Lapidilactobacillus bayanensis]
MSGEVFSKLITSVNPKIMNYSSRGGHKIDRIVIHHNATTNKNVAMNTWVKGGRANTSAHYEVTPTEIIGCISESDAAWHCGGTGGADKPKMSYPNQRSIGIENVNKTGAPKWEVDHKTIINTAKLVADICKRYGIPLDRQHVLGHKEVTATACPGGINVDEVVQLAKGYYYGGTHDEPGIPGKAGIPAAKPASTGWIKQNGTFTVTTPGGIKLRSGSASTKSPLIAVLPKGSVVKYNAYGYAGGYVWIRQPRNNGYGYLPTGNASGNKRTSYWGNFK